MLAHVVYMMRSSNKEVQRYVATSMARLAPTGQLKSIFCDKNGLDILLDMLTAQPANGTAMRESAQALLELAKKVRAGQGQGRGCRMRIVAGARRCAAGALVAWTGVWDARGASFGQARCGVLPVL